MELGEKIRAARLQLGLSQRQLCGDAITRNMLSQIENGSARPSMHTLGYLAQRLGKTVSYFLEEQAVTSPNQSCMERARQALEAGDGRTAVELLEDFKEPDGVFTQEKRLLQYLGYLQVAERALEEGRQPYAVNLLEKAGAIEGLYITGELQRRRLLLLGQAGQKVAQLLVHEDEALLLRARESLDAGDAERCLALLGAVQGQEAPLWQLLQAQGELALGQYAGAVEHFKGAEAAYPKQAYAGLEVCCRELGDYKQAYEYACKQRG